MKMQGTDLQSWCFTQWNIWNMTNYRRATPPTHTGSPILFPCPRTRCVSAGVLHLLTVLPATPWSIGPISATRPASIGPTRRNQILTDPPLNKDFRG